jgi:hypothetical protein
LEFIDFTCYVDRERDEWFRTLSRSIPRELTALTQRHPIGNRGAAIEHAIAEGRLPVPSGDELGTIQELRVIQKSPGEVGTIKYSFEKVGTFKMGA